MLFHIFVCSLPCLLRFRELWFEMKSFQAVVWLLLKTVAQNQRNEFMLHNFAHSMAGIYDPRLTREGTMGFCCG